MKALQMTDHSAGNIFNCFDVCLNVWYCSQRWSNDKFAPAFDSQATVLLLTFPMRYEPGSLLLVNLPSGLAIISVHWKKSCYCSWLCTTFYGDFIPALVSSCAADYHMLLSAVRIGKWTIIHVHFNIKTKLCVCCKK